MTTQKQLAFLEIKNKTLQGGGEARQVTQKKQGKMLARERILALLDPQSFVEIGALVTHQNDFAKTYGDGVITGFGNIHGQNVYVFAQDFTVFGGSLGEAHAAKICKLMDLALKNGAPVIGINDSGGARIQEGVAALGGYADIFLRNVMASGVIPQISLIMGPCAGGAVYSPALTDFTLMVDKTSHMFITGPDVIKAVTHEEIDKETLGGAKTHASKSGVAHFCAASEIQALEITRELLSFIPPNNCTKPSGVATPDAQERLTPELTRLIPENTAEPYDIRHVISVLADEGSFFEVHEAFAQNIVVGFSRFMGQTVGIIGNQPMVLAGCLDIKASIKAARFVRFCDAFNIPLLTLVDVPGFLPGVAQEEGAIILHGAKLLYAFAEATVPKVTLVLRKAYGGAYDVMSSKHIRGDINLALPTAEIAVVGAEGAVNILYKRELAESPNINSTRQKLIEEYNQQFSSPYLAASKGYIDAVIEAKDARPTIIQSLKMLQNKVDSNPRKKHGNIPL